MTPSKTKFIIEDGNELKEACIRHKVKIQPVIDSIVHRKSEYYLLKYWSLRGFMTGAAAEMYDYTFFNLVNSWNDDKLSTFLSKQDNSFLHEFCKYITSEFLNWPITRIPEYYGSYYPKSWQIMKKFR